MSRLEFGRIRQLPSGTYQAQYALPDGSERTGPRTFDSYDEARRFLEAVAAEMKRGEWVDPRLAAIPFGEYARGWLTQRTDPLSPRTEELYRQQLRSHILPTWEATPLSAISPQGIRAWYAEHVESGRSRGVAAKSYRLIRAILDTAVEDERIRRNPCRLRNAGVERWDERIPPTLDELALLLDATPPRYRLLIELAAWVRFALG